ncbi:hypothetical protein SPSIL_040260 [Sporomusa silvacetica DSM 10669]|uniref:AB hydrolase-1 domain-containing protein n=1 Tax=Sporomusa silvacetica DSM 10669 TaxID=1123289 RepID=A0ABZ3IQ48_9FIRM|nr:alpha/beta fold hydrolase [Sporomusa silvacetica]OZC17215.1 alpha/beta hydrolase family protein [Sporomusa silvacetica DSM 10669]
MKKIILTAFLALSLITGSASAMSKSVSIADQGSFAAGGTVVQTPGALKPEEPMNPAGQTLHGDHAYVFYQKPVHAHKYPLVFLHGGGQSAKTWETTPDGRDGFQNIFLGRGYSTYLVDQPRRGRAGQGTVDGTVSASTLDQFWYAQFRLGIWPNYYEGVQFPKGEEALNQFLRQITPNTGDFDKQVISDSMTAVFEKSGDGILVSHSQGGGPGWLTAVKSNKVKAVVSFEPWDGFFFPEGEVPEAIQTSSPFGALEGTPIAMEDFLKLTKIPILVYYGDNIPDKPSKEWNGDSWHARLDMARIWVDTINRHGGDATLVHLPEIGIYGNTHFIISDLNNVQIANHMSVWMHEKGLDK